MTMTPAPTDPAEAEFIAMLLLTAPADMEQTLRELRRLAQPPEDDATQD